MVREIWKRLAISDASKAWWAQFTPEQRRAEMKRCAKVRAENAAAKQRGAKRKKKK
jgi:hypothetical protein